MDVNLQGSEIFEPFIGMLILTFIVWVVMYVRRIGYIVSHRIDAQQLTTPEKGAKIIPEEIHWSAYNFRNLFELPVVFYVLCLYLFVTNSVDGAYVVGAWVFLVSRVVHSLIHCTVNIVKLRFASYFLGALVLWSMVVRAALELIG
jgi:hypothetical protein